MRYLDQTLKRDLKKKLILLSGPRQCGKTTLAQNLSPSLAYLNFDVPEERLLIQQHAWDRNRELLVLDEIHKMKNWKLFLKGIVDSRQHRMQTMVTGSARLEVARKVGDSLAGRYFLHRLHPIDIKEARQCFEVEPQDALQRIMNVSGFPEPFLLNNVGEYRRWRTTHTDIILRQDLIQLEVVENLTFIETLIELLRIRVGSPVSYANLAQDLGCAPKSVKRWLEILENLYIVFRIRPYSRKLSRAITKAPKFYFYDCASVKGDDGARFENLVALSLRKEVDLRRDSFGDDLELQYVRNKDGDEIDFLVTNQERPTLAVEAKWSDDTPHKSFKVFAKDIVFTKAIQLVGKLQYEKTYPFGLEIRDAANWLARVSLMD
jgi:uncharacterized protein